MTLSLPELHHQVAFGRSGGKIIWQPRIGCWYNDKMFADGKLPAPWTGMDRPAIYRELGCSARIYEFNKCFVRVEDPSVTITTRQISDTDTEELIDTPVGQQRSVMRKTDSSPRAKRIKWPVSYEDELKVATWRAERATWQWDQQTFEQIQEKWQGLGAPTMHIPRVNIQDLFINTMGVEQTIYALYDWPDTVHAYFRALDDLHDRMIDLINESPMDIINFGDNLHCGTLPPDLFRRYVLPAYHRRIDRLHAAGKFVHSHWDGDTKALLPLARESRLDGIEAITPRPQGDVTIEEIKDALGDDIFLIDGLPAILFDLTFPESMLIDYTHQLIELFAPKLILGISDELSSTGDIERIRTVGRIVDEYNRKQD